MHCEETDDGRILLATDLLRATIAKRGYVSGITSGSFVDNRTGAVDPGFGLLVMDFLLAPGWRDDGYSRDPKYHGERAKHCVEGPQICTGAGQLEYEIITGRKHLAVRQWFTYSESGSGYRRGSQWTQTILLLPGRRYVLACETITSVNDVDCLSYRMDIPGHAKHDGADTFGRIYLSYHGMIDATELDEDFPPDARFHYLRNDAAVPDRFIRAIELRRPDGQTGPWLAGMTLDPTLPYEAWCHQRGYACFIQENHGRPVQSGQTIGAAYVMGYFDSVEQMEQTYDQFRGVRGLRVDAQTYETCSQVQLHDEHDQSEAAR